MAINRLDRLSEVARSGLLYPYDSPANRIAIDRFVKDIPLTNKHRTYPVLEAVERNLQLLQAFPNPLRLGCKRLVFSTRVSRTSATKASLLEPTDSRRCGHYVMEEGAIGSNSRIKNLLLSSMKLTTHSDLSQQNCMRSNVFVDVRRACEIEATANQGWQRPSSAQTFPNTTYSDFMKSSAILETVWSETNRCTCWTMDILSGQAIREQVGRNTNLGIILLLHHSQKRVNSSSLAGPLPSHDVLAQLDASDAKRVYEAIRLANTWAAWARLRSMMSMHSLPRA